MKTGAIIGIVFIVLLLVFAVVLTIFLILRNNQNTSGVTNPTNNSTNATNGRSTNATLPAPISPIIPSGPTGAFLTLGRSCSVTPTANFTAYTCDIATYKPNNIMINYYIYKFNNLKITTSDGKSLYFTTNGNIGLNANPPYNAISTWSYDGISIYPAGYQNYYLTYQGANQALIVSQSQSSNTAWLFDGYNLIPVSTLTSINMLYLKPEYTTFSGANVPILIANMYQLNNQQYGSPGNPLGIIIK